MSTPVFVQTDGRIVDVTKILHMKLLARDRLAITFVGGDRLELPGSEAAELLSGIAELDRHRALVAYRVGSTRRAS